MVEVNEGWCEGVRARLLDWYSAHARDLPWRGTRDPYAVLVSEMMLIQTTVAAAGPYFERFMARFPTIAALASASEAEVLKAWEGLGYYRRARQLHEAARRVEALHGGKLPMEAQALRALPGVGRYVAGAVASIAFDLAEPIVEANSERVLARLSALTEAVSRVSARERLWRLAARLVPPKGAGAFNQALIDLGATICTPAEPRCLICPLLTLCEGRRRGLERQIPLKSPKAPPSEGRERAVLIRDQRRIALLQRDGGSLWRGMWELPTVAVAGANPARRATVSGGSRSVSRTLERITGLKLRVGPVQETVRYTVTRYRIELELAIARVIGGDLRPIEGWAEARWVAEDELSVVAISSPMRKALGKFEIGL